MVHTTWVRPGELCYMGVVLDRGPAGVNGRKLHAGAWDVSTWEEKVWGTERENTNNSAHRDMRKQMNGKQSPPIKSHLDRLPSRLPLPRHDGQLREFCSPLCSRVFAIPSDPIQTSSYGPL